MVSVRVDISSRAHNGRIHHRTMIHLTRRNKSTLVVNLGSIQYVEATPDTAIVFNNGERIWVVETVEEVVARALAYQRAVFREGVFVLPRGADADEARE